MTKEELNKWFCETVGSCEGVYHFYLNSPRGEYKLFDLFKVGSQDWDTLTDMLIGDTDPITIPNGSKLYIVSNSSFTIDRWDKYIKEKSHIRVENMEDADYIIGNNESIVREDKLPKCTLLGYEGSGERYVNDNDSWINNIDPTLSQNRIRGKLPANNTSYNNCPNSWIFEEGVRILYAKLELNISIINDLTIRDQIIINTPLDKEAYHTLNGMFGAEEADKMMARKILFDCDIPRSKYWIWKLSKNHRWNMTCNRSKLGKNFQETCDWSTLKIMDHEEILEHLYSTDQLTTEIFAELKVQFLEDITKALNKNMQNIVYDANSVLSINEKYKPFDIKSEPIIIELISLNYKGELDDLEDEDEEEHDED